MSYITKKQREELEKIEKTIERPSNSSYPRATRVEVIDRTKSFDEGGGRAYVFRREDIRVSLSIQDEGRTLKLFIENK